MTKHHRIRDVLRETLQENFRKGGFLRIYPSKNSNIYDRYFKDCAQPAQIFGTQMHSLSQLKITNRLLHSLLFTDDLLPYQNP